MEVNAAAMVFFHNHPSGVAEPSRADDMITRRLKEALALIDVRVHPEKSYYLIFLTFFGRGVNLQSFVVGPAKENPEL
jgi:proteasome lid subunit RPN8/RPN11